MVYATVVAEAGPFADPREVREHIDRFLSAAAKPAKGKRAPKRSAGLSAAQARRMASDLDAYDAEMTGRRRG